MYTAIQTETFHDKIIDLKTSLTVYDVECVTLFLTCSPQKEWRKVDLFSCNIQDHGVHIMHRSLTLHDITINKKMDLSYNGLTTSSSSSIKDLVIHCRVEELSISFNRTIGEDLNPTFYNMLSLHSSRLVALYMNGTSLSSPSAVNLFTALSKKNKLQYLNINNNLITGSTTHSNTAA